MSDEDSKAFHRDVDVIFLGAGFSRAATDGQAPLMRDFFVGLDERKYWSLNAYLRAVYHDDLAQANVEEALCRLEQCATTPLGGVDPFFRLCKANCPDIKADLNAYILEKLGSLRYGTRNWASNLLHDASQHTTIITTNYDNIAEKIISNRRGLKHRRPDTNCPHCRMCRILYEECEVGGGWGATGMLRPVWEGALLKLHGSVAWSMCECSECNSCQCLMPDQHCRVQADVPCPDCGNVCAPVLVLPSMHKALDERYRGLRNMWEAAYAAFREAKRVFFIGFSFPATDASISEMIRSTLGDPKSPCREIALFDVGMDGPVAQLTKLLDRRTDDVTIYEQLVPRDGSRPEWFVEPPEEPEQQRRVAAPARRLPSDQA